MFIISKKLIENYSILLHSIIKSQVNKKELKKFCDSIEKYILILKNKKKFNIGHLSYKDIDKIIKKIIEYDDGGSIVYSCMSISILIHIYLCLEGVPSDIIIGTCVIENKLYSHAWVRTKDNRLFDYRFDNYKYRELKKISFLKN